MITNQHQPEDLRVESKHNIGEELSVNVNPFTAMVSSDDSSRSTSVASNVNNILLANNTIANIINGTASSGANNLFQSSRNSSVTFPSSNRFLIPSNSIPIIVNSGIQNSANVNRSTISRNDLSIGGTFSSDVNINSNGADPSNDASSVEYSNDNQFSNEEKTNGKKKYTQAALTQAVEDVIAERMVPVEAIAYYNIARRTFFRHLKTRREQLGLAQRGRSRPTSRSTSPGESKPTVKNESEVQNAQRNNIFSNGLNEYSLVDILRRLNGANAQIKREEIAIAETQEGSSVEDTEVNVHLVESDILDGTSSEDSDNKTLEIDE